MAPGLLLAADGGEWSANIADPCPETAKAFTPGAQRQLALASGFQLVARPVVTRRAAMRWRLSLLIEVKTPPT